jgi:hypothetical protein
LLTFSQQQDWTLQLFNDLRGLCLRIRPKRRPTKVALRPKGMTLSRKADPEFAGFHRILDV